MLFDPKPSSSVTLKILNANETFIQYKYHFVNPPHQGRINILRKFEGASNNPAHMTFIQKSKLKHIKLDYSLPK